MNSVATRIPPAVRVLREEYLRRKGRNVRYSMRSFCRDIGMSQSLFSQILRGKRSLTLKQSVRIADRIELSGRDRAVLLGRAAAIASGGRRRTDGTRRGSSGEYESPEFFRTERGFDLHWTETAVFGLTFMARFRPDVSWIARELRISRETALEALEALEKKELVRYDGDRIVRTHRKIYYESSTSVPYVRQYCLDMMGKAAEELKRSDPQSCSRRAINGFTLAVDPSKVPEAKKRLSRFFQELGDFLTAGDPTELYQLNLQFFPLSQASEPALRPLRAADVPSS